MKEYLNYFCTTTVQMINNVLISPRNYSKVWELLSKRNLTLICDFYNQPAYSTVSLAQFKPARQCTSELSILLTPNCHIENVCPASHAKPHDCITINSPEPISTFLCAATILSAHCLKLPGVASSMVITLLSLTAVCVTLDKFLPTLLILRINTISLKS